MPDIREQARVCWPVDWFGCGDQGLRQPAKKAKRDALNEWVKAVNDVGGFGRWVWDVAFKPSDVHDIITKHAAVAGPVE